MCHIASVETPISRSIPMDYMPSAMKGVVLTSTGEILATPTPAELVNLFKCSPKVGLNFGKIFDFEGDSGEKASQKQHEDDGASPPPSPSSRKERAKDKDKDKDDALSENSTSSSGTSAANTRKQPTAVAVPPTRIRRPSIHRCQPATSTTSTSDPAAFNSIDDNGTSASNGHGHAKPLPHPHLRPSGSSSNLAAAAAVVRSLPIPVPKSHASPEYDFADEENLPSPFLKNVDKAAAKDAAVAAASSSSSLIPLNVLAASGPSSSSKGPQSAHSGSGLGSSSVTLSSKVKRRESSGLLLRAVAAANNIRRGTPSTSASNCVVPMKMNRQTS